MMRSQARRNSAVLSCSSILLGLLFTTEMKARKVSAVPHLACWIRAKDEKWFQPFFDRHPEIEIHNALTREVNLDQADGLLLTGGSDIAKDEKWFQPFFDRHPEIEIHNALTRE